jgi:hypothetical protein
VTIRLIGYARFSYLDLTKRQIAPFTPSQLRRREMSNSYESNAGKEVLIPITFLIPITPILGVK